MYSCISKLLHLADGAHLFTEANDDRGFSSFCEGYILDEGSGFVQEGSLLIGINISVKSPRKVPADLSCASNLQVACTHAQAKTYRSWHEP